MYANTNDLLQSEYNKYNANIDELKVKNARLMSDMDRVTVTTNICYYYRIWEAKTRN